MKKKISSTTYAAMQNPALRKLLSENALRQNDASPEERAQRRQAIVAGYRRSGRYRVSSIDRLRCVSRQGARHSSVVVVTDCHAMYNVYGAGKVGYLQSNTPHWSRTRRWGRLTKDQRRAECRRLRAADDPRWTEYWVPQGGVRGRSRYALMSPEEQAVRGRCRRVVPARVPRSIR